eukprot:TRINITY_DN16389_c0_g1_i1.p1 TRINITY_DN16389_c0_g1~~TRINITY_DN16389_c0_g1_i1.p1  ORF type:complete len:656 (+),score=114.00 TRINITY_DN16389_c0_g1_i1:40-1968(+)
MPHGGDDLRGILHYAQLVVTRLQDIIDSEHGSWRIGEQEGLVTGNSRARRMEMEEHLNERSNHFSRGELDEAAIPETIVRDDVQFLQLVPGEIDAPKASPEPDRPVVPRAWTPSRPHSGNSKNRADRRESKEAHLSNLRDEQMIEEAKAGQKDALEHIQKDKSLAGQSAESVKKEILMVLSLQDADFGSQEPMHRFGSVASTAMFEMVTAFVIAFSILWQCIDLELNDEVVLYNADWSFIIMENIFCTFFSFEIIVRFLSYSHPLAPLKDLRFTFDAVLLILMILEVWIVSPVLKASSMDGSTLADKASIFRVGRIFKILRTARMARLVKLIPELFVLLKGLAVACRSVMFTLLLLCIITYVFGSSLTLLSRGSGLEKTHFTDTLTAMWILVASIVLPDQGPFLQEIGQESWPFGAICLLFTLLSCFCILNMLTGILVEVVKNVTDSEREVRDINFAQRTLLTLIRNTDADTDDDQRLSRQEFLSLLAKPQAIRTLTSIGVDVLGAIDLVDVLYEVDTPLPFAIVMRHMLMLRGNNTATVKDVVDVRKFISLEFDMLYNSLSALSLRAHDSESAPPMMEADTLRSLPGSMLSGKSPSARPSILSGPGQTGKSPSSGRPSVLSQEAPVRQVSKSASMIKGLLR